MLKRILSVLLLAALACSFAACGGETGEPVSSNTPADSASVDTAEPSAEESGEEINGSTDGEESEDTAVHLQPPEGVDVVYGQRYEKDDSLGSAKGEVPMDVSPDEIYSDDWIIEINKQGTDTVFYVMITPNSTEYKAYKEQFRNEHVDNQLITKPFSFEELKKAYEWMIDSDRKTLSRYGIEAELHWTGTAPFKDSVFYDYVFFAYVDGETLLEYFDGLNAQRIESGAKGERPPFACGGKVTLIPKDFSAAELGD